MKQRKTPQLNNSQKNPQNQKPNQPIKQKPEVVTINLKWSEDKIDESTLQVTLSWEKCWQFNVVFNTTLRFFT